MSKSSTVDRSAWVYRWDLDKTYLHTDFDTVRDLIRTALEPPTRKRAVPGATVLLQEIHATHPAGIFILSGSPEQMRQVLEAKLRLDGIDWDGFTLKPSLQKLMRGKFRFLRDQVSYKLTALLRARTTVDPRTREVLFGDDAEADAFIYSLYADLALGRVGRDMLMNVLQLAGVYVEDIPQIIRIADRIPRSNAVGRIFIHLDRVSSFEAFEDFGTRVCPFYNYFQPALVLLQDGLIDVGALFRVGEDLVVSHGFNPDVLIASAQDLADRNYVDRGLIQKIRVAITREGFEYPDEAGDAIEEFCRVLLSREDRFDEIARISIPDIDYVELFPRDRARAKAAKMRAIWPKKRS
ncbi:MAG: phosphatase domain-containing protein [Polyangiales bacterium]